MKCTCVGQERKKERKKEMRERERERESSNFKLPSVRNLKACSSVSQSVPSDLEALRLSSTSDMEAILPHVSAISHHSFENISKVFMALILLRNSTAKRFDMSSKSLDLDSLVPLAYLSALLILNFYRSQQTQQITLRIFRRNHDTQRLLSKTREIISSVVQMVTTMCSKTVG